MKAWLRWDTDREKLMSSGKDTASPVLASLVQRVINSTKSPPLTRCLMRKVKTLNSCKSKSTWKILNKSLQNREELTSQKIEFKIWTLAHSRQSERTIKMSAWLDWWVLTRKKKSIWWVHNRKVIIYWIILVNSEVHLQHHQRKGKSRTALNSLWLWVVWRNLAVDFKTLLWIRRISSQAIKMNLVSLLIMLTQG